MAVVWLTRSENEVTTAMGAYSKHDGYSWLVPHGTVPTNGREPFYLRSVIVRAKSAFPILCVGHTV